MMGGGAVLGRVDNYPTPSSTVAHTLSIVSHPFFLYLGLGCRNFRFTLNGEEGWGIQWWVKVYKNKAHQRRLGQIRKGFDWVVKGRMVRLGTAGPIDSIPLSPPPSLPLQTRSIPRAHGRRVGAGIPGVGSIPSAL